MSAQRKGGWGSLLGSAVAGLESRLDTMLADDEQAAAKAKAAAETAKQAADKQRLQVDEGGYTQCGAARGLRGKRIHG
jgi:hypothetical protein